MGAFGIGQAAEGIKGTAFNTFLLFYYQQIMGVSGVFTGLALAIALVLTPSLILLPALFPTKSGPAGEDDTRSSW